MSAEDKFQIDCYGIKVSGSIKPIPPEELDPSSWKEVWQRVNRSLMSIVSGIPAFVDDTIKGARSFARGFGAIPSSIASRISQGHSDVDKDEARKEQMLREGKLQLLSLEEAESNLRDQLEALRKKGLEVRVIQQDERWIVTALPPGESEKALAEFQKMEDVKRLPPASLS